MHGAVRRDHAVAVVQDLVADEECQFILETSVLIAQPLVHQHRSRRLEPRSDERPRGLAAAAHGRVIEPSHLQAVTLADRHQCIQGQRHLAAAALLGGALDVGKAVVAGFLPDPDQQVRKLTARGAGLRQQLGQRVLQQFIGKQERRLERHGLEAAALPRGRHLDLGVFVEKPSRIAPEDA